MTTHLDNQSHNGGAHGSVRTYVIVWALLLVLLFVSLALGNLEDSSLMLISVFALATIKAVIVLTQFMHLRAEPRHVPLVLLSGLLLLLVAFVGMVIDVSLGYSLIGAT